MKKTTCYVCSGTGKETVGIDHSFERTCTACEGKGYIEEPEKKSS